MKCLRRTVACGREKEERERIGITFFFPFMLSQDRTESLVIERGICTEGTPSTAVLDKMFK